MEGYEGGRFADDPVALSAVGVLSAQEESICRLVQDAPVVQRLLEDEVPPSEYYEELRVLLLQQFPCCDPALLEHVVALLAAVMLRQCSG